MFGRLIGVALALIAGSASAQTISPAMKLQFVEVDNSGATDVAAAINAAIGSGNKILQFRCGTYLVASSLLVVDNTVLDGQGCATLKMSASMAANTTMHNAIDGTSATLRTILSNASGSGNSNIVVKNFTLDGTLSPGNTHLALFYKTTGHVFENNTCVGDGTTDVQDCVANIQSSNYVVRGNKCSAVDNACYDQWDGSHDFQVTNNDVEGGGTLSYGVLVNGLATNNTANRSYRGVISGNTIRSVDQVGIWAGGLKGTGNATGIVDDVEIIGNIIATSNLHGIFVSDGARNSVVGNNIRNSAANGIRVGSQTNVSATITVTIASPAVVTWTGHVRSNGDSVMFTTTGALPTGLLPNVAYYVINSAVNTFQLAATPGGSAINTSGSQSGTHTGWNSVTDSTSVSGNNVSDTNTSAGGNSAIEVVNHATNTTISGNSVRGALQSYGVSAASGTVNTTIYCGQMTAGATGYAINSGTGGAKVCQEGNELRINSQYNMRFGIAGANDQLTLDVGGNLTPASTNRYLGASTAYWSRVYGKDFYVTKQTTGAAAPGAGFARLEVVAGTTAGTCKLIVYAGTSTTPTTLLDDIGGGC